MQAQALQYMPIGQGVSYTLTAQESERYDSSTQKERNSITHKSNHHAQNRENNGQKER